MAAIAWAWPAPLQECSRLPAIQEHFTSPSTFVSRLPQRLSLGSSRPRPCLAAAVGSTGHRVQCLSAPASPAREAEADLRLGAANASPLFHRLPNSLRLEVLRQPPAKGTAPKPSPLLFVHGSYHAAWCWREHWMPFFAERGYDCFAVSILGQGESDSPAAPVAGTIQSHAADISNVIKEVIRQPPVLIGHSFGGLIVQAYLSLLAFPEGPPLEPISAAVLACSVPPSGNKDLVVRFLLTRPILSVKVTLALAAKMFATNTDLCRDSFFSPSMPENEVKRYQELLAQSSKMPLFDLRKLNSSLPVPRPPAAALPPILVLGAENDAVLDEQALKEAAEFFGSSYTVVPSIAHDIMLDDGWERAAETLLTWIETNVPAPN